ncbi:MAG: PAS domain-containing protein [Phycisphaeraceae bacterium]|nr:PAS domain-containing protein [Phycisphaeraceae bacterium]
MPKPSHADPSQTPVPEAAEVACSPRSARLAHAWLMRGESSVASIGMVLSAIVLAVLAACAYWTMRTQSDSLEQTRLDQLLSAGQMLAQSSERMLAAGDVTPVRRMMMDGAERFGLERLRIVLPSGDVIADNDPSRITASLDDAHWQSGGGIEQTIVNDGQNLDMRLPLTVEGFGTATLEIEAGLTPDRGTLWQAQAGIGTIGVAALLALWVVYRYFRSRLAAMGMIRESLLALGGGEQSETALAVTGHLSREAAAWNDLLQERQRYRRQAAVRQTKQQMGDRRSGNNDLASGCDAMSQGVILLDDKMRVVYANNAAAVFFATQRDQLAGQPLIDHLKDAGVADVIHDAVMGSKRTTHIHDRRTSGGAGVIRYAVRPVREGDTASALLVIEDVTQQRVAEEARHEFVAQATHELRTPLTNIRLYVESAIDEGDKDAVLRAKCLNVINQETQRLERMVNDMLSVAEIEAGTLQIQRDDVRLDRLLGDLRNDYEAQAATKEIQMQFTIPPKLPVIQGDREKLAVAVQNLLGNALKYTNDGGRVSVSVEVKEKDLVIEVTDSGIGISPEDQTHVFEKFYRARDKRISGITGSGLGLGLAREIIRLHGGDISLDSQLDHGSTFTISLPVGEQTEETATE